MLKNIWTLWKNLDAHKNIRAVFEILMLLKNFGGVYEG
jgi:hypothetical protein